jgi:hypothetical protein
MRIVSTDIGNETLLTKALFFFVPTKQQSTIVPVSRIAMTMTYF